MNRRLLIPLALAITVALAVVWPKPRITPSAIASPSTPGAAIAPPVIRADTGRYHSTGGNTAPQITVTSKAATTPAPVYPTDDVPVDPGDVPARDAAPPDILYWLGWKTLSPSAERSLVQAYGRWAAREPQIALDHALTYLHRSTRLDAAEAALTVWAQSDVRAAASYVSSLLTPGHDFLTYSMARLYAVRAPDEALQWALTSAPPEYRRGAAQHSMMQWLQQDPQAALNWVAGYRTSTHTLSLSETVAVWEGVSAFVSQDMNAARQFVESLPVGGGAREIAGKALLDHLALDDPPAAAAWLAAQPDSPHWDASLALVAGQIATSDPRTARTLTARITDADLKERTIAQLSR